MTIRKQPNHLSESSVQRSVSMPYYLWVRTDEVARNKGLSRSEFVRDLIEKELASYKGY